MGEMSDISMGVSASAAAAIGAATTYNNYNLTIHSQANTEQVAADFEMMRAWA